MAAPPWARACTLPSMSPCLGGDYADVLAQLLAQGAPAPANEVNLPDALQDVGDAAVDGRSSWVGMGSTSFGR